MRAFVFCLALLAPVAAHAADDAKVEPQAAAAAPAGKAVLDKELPGLLTHPAYDTFKAFSLKALQPYSNGLITDERLAAVEAELKAINPAG